MSKYGIKINRSRVEEILKIDPHRNKKEVELFIIKINLLHRFIPNLAGNLKEITDMLKNDT